MICYGQHTAITFVTFATAHCSMSIFAAVTVENVASDGPRSIIATACPTFTVVRGVWVLETPVRVSLLIII